MPILNHLENNLIDLSLVGSTKEEVLAELVDILMRAGKIVNRDALIDVLLEREGLGSTGIGHGVAIPHATVSSVDSTILLVAVAPDAIRFGPPESEPCRIFFLLLSPPGQESEHIKLLARLSRLVRHPGFVETLGGSRSTEGVLEAIRDVDAQHV